jgi:hypothetical protein
MAKKPWFEFHRQSDGSSNVRAGWGFILVAVIVVAVLCVIVQ